MYCSARQLLMVASLVQLPKQVPYLLLVLGQFVVLTPPAIQEVHRAVGLTLSTVHVAKQRVLQCTRSHAAHETRALLNAIFVHRMTRHFPPVCVLQSWMGAVGDSPSRS